MDFIKISKSDADKALKFMRNEILTENNSFEEFKESVAEETKKHLEELRFRGVQVPEGRSKEASNFAFLMIEKMHEEKIKELTKIVELFLVGSDEYAGE